MPSVKPNTNPLYLAASHLFTVGDKVEYVRDWDHKEEKLYKNVNGSCSDYGRGTDGVVLAINSDGSVKVEIDGCEEENVPFTILAVTRKNDGSVIDLGDYEAEISEDGSYLDVGCQNFSFAEVKKVYDEMVKRQPKPKAKPAAKKATKKAAAKKTTRGARAMR